MSAAYSATTLVDSIRLMLPAIPLPAISKAVPWSTELLIKGSPKVRVTDFSKSRVLQAMWPWSWYRDRIASYLPDLPIWNTESAGTAPLR